MYKTIIAKAVCKSTCFFNSYRLSSLSQRHIACIQISHLTTFPRRINLRLKTDKMLRKFKLAVKKKKESSISRAQQSWNPEKEVRCVLELRTLPCMVTFGLLRTLTTSPWLSWATTIPVVVWYSLFSWLSEITLPERKGACP